MIAENYLTRRARKIPYALVVLVPNIERTTKYTVVVPLMVTRVDGMGIPIALAAAIWLYGVAFPVTATPFPPV